MDTQETTRILAKVPLFHGLKEKQLKRLAARAVERQYNAGDIIVEQAKLGVGLFVLIAGEADVIRTQVDGSTVNVDTVMPGDFFGELSLLDEMPRTASVIAKTETTCLAINKLDFMDEIQDDAEIALAMLKTMAQRFRRILLNL